MPSSPPADPDIALVQPDDLEALRLEWSALWRRSGATPFAAPEWLLPWARHHAPGRTAAVALRRGGRLAALMPVFAWEGAMLLAGTGPSDHGDLLHEPGCDPALPVLLAALPGLSCGAWVRLDLQQLPPASPLATAPAPPSWSDETRPGEPCHRTPLLGPDGLGAASARQRANWRYAVRRLGRQGGTIGLVPDAGVPEAVEDLVRLHGLRWQARGQPGLFADPLLGRFLRDAAPALARAGLLRLNELRFGPRRAALLMVLAGRRAHHYYLGGFDPAFANLSPSATLIGAAMQAAHREGASAFDFLRGAEPYKRRWGAEPHETRRRLLTPPPQ